MSFREEFRLVENYQALAEFCGSGLRSAAQDIDNQLQSKTVRAPTLFNAKRTSY
jgi:hypothetical protein